MASHCSNCGAKTVETAAYCYRCGCSLATVEQPSDRGETVAGSPTIPSSRNLASRDLEAGEEAGQAGVPKAELELAAESAQQLWSGRYSPLGLMPVWILFVLMTLAIGGICIPLVGLWKALFIMLVCGVISWGGVGLYLAYRRLNAHYDLNSQQFVRYTGLRTRRINQLDLIDIDDIAFGQGPIQRYLGVGTIQLTSGGRSRPEQLLLEGIADVKGVATKIDEARRAERRRRGLYIEIMDPPQPK